MTEQRSMELLNEIIHYVSLRLRPNETVEELLKMM